MSVIKFWLKDELEYKSERLDLLTGRISKSKYSKSDIFYRESGFMSRKRLIEVRNFNNIVLKFFADRTKENLVNIVNLLSKITIDNWYIVR